MKGRTMHDKQRQPVFDSVFEPELLSVMTIALERAWSRLVGGGFVFEREDFALSTRTLLAQGILEKAQTGVVCLEALSEAGLVHLRRSSGA
ncbi:MAG: hypothetical protein BGP06_16335 [Rhizobiales bacterium 65-9]|nr:MAG: hypothetical protein BGP06_16335 [Rhizobiales bacterium 65-9]